MAARARARREEREAIDRAEGGRAWQRMRAGADAEGVALAAGMTLGGATRLLRVPSWACACIGPPYCCRFAFDQARALQRAAHVSVKLFADRLARG